MQILYTSCIQPNSNKGTFGSKISDIMLFNAVDTRTMHI